MTRQHGFPGALLALGPLCVLVLIGCSQAGSGAPGGGGAGGNVTGQGGMGNPGGAANQAGQGAGGSAAGVSGGGGAANAAAGDAGAGAPGAGGTAGAGAPGAGGTAGAGGNGAGGVTAETYPKPATPPADEDGSQLWLRYPNVPIPGRLAEYRAAFTHVVKAGSSTTLQAAQAELVKGLSGLTGTTIPVADQATGAGALVLGTPASSPIVSALSLTASLAAVGQEGYLVQATQVAGKAAIVVAANTDIGVLYGAFALLRQLQTHHSIQGLSLSSAPKIKRRILDHWDNLDGTIERGFAGKSLWNWNALPSTLSPRYTDYARANASIGINGVVLNNVNADAQILTNAYLDKVAALATVFRPYGITVYLSAQFGAPSKIGGLTTADPLNSAVKKWWTDLANTIYQKIPDFGGFLVKANSEGQPGPADYGRTHADGANMMAAALAPHNGIVMWRAFVYADDGTDRAAQPYREFKPLDGKFAANVVVQVKNGPIDFQPREVVHPMFGAMPSTAIGLELQVTKEYLGEDTHLAYLGALYEEVLKTDTYSKGQGSTVARVIDGSLDNHALSAIAGVANVGSDTNWAGSDFNQANWYVFGRLAWNPDLASQDVADEWIRETFSNDPAVVAPVTQMMMASRQNMVNYMEPLGLLHMMGTDTHYGPAPWVSDQSTLNWNPTYYHQASATGIGFDRTATGSNMVAQYAPTLRDKLLNRSTIPDDFLLFFQRAGWDDKLASSGRTIWEELVYRYSLGVDAVQTTRDTWKMVQGRIDGKRYDGVTSFLQIQHYEARWWRDACLQYFGSLSKHTVPSGYAAPAHDLTYYQNLQKTCPADATKPRCPAVYTGTPSPAILN